MPRVRFRCPSYTDKTPEEILEARPVFSCEWYLLQALCWLDYAKRKTNVTALRYAALEVRSGIEQLWFECIIISVGGKLGRDAYAKCRGKATKMYKVLDRLQPDYEKLMQFIKLTLEGDPNAPSIIEWDLSRLKRLHSNVSECLHFHGIFAETWASSEWFVKNLTVIEEAATYLREQLENGQTGATREETMPPEVRDMWVGFKTGKLTKDDVRFRLKIAHPVLQRRRLMRRGL